MNMNNLKIPNIARRIIPINNKNGTIHVFEKSYTSDCGFFCICNRLEFQENCVILLSIVNYEN